MNSKLETENANQMELIFGEYGTGSTWKFTKKCD